MPTDKGARSTTRSRRQFQRSAVGDGDGYGDGLIFDVDNSELSINLATNSGLGFVTEQLTIDLRDTTPCLELAATGIGAIVKTSGGLQRTTDGLARDDFSGTVFPTTGLYAGYEFFRTDLNEWFVYNGTTWLGEVFTLTFGRNTGAFFPTGTFGFPPMGSVSAAKPHGHPVFQDIKIIGMQFKGNQAWNGDIKLYMGNTLLHTESMAAVQGFAVDLDEDVDSHATDGLNLEGTQTGSGSMDDGICFIKVRRRIDP